MSVEHYRTPGQAAHPMHWDFEWKDTREQIALACRQHLRHIQKELEDMAKDDSNVGSTSTGLITHEAIERIFEPAHKATATLRTQFGKAKAGDSAKAAKALRTLAGES